MQTKSDQKYIEFYFDPISPYVWLAASRFENIMQRTGCQIIAIPVLFAGLLNANNHKGPAEIPSKRDYIFRDAMRRAHAYGLEIQGPPKHPFNPLLPLRICTAVENDELRIKIARRLIDAAWSQGADITDPDTVARLMENSDIDPDWALDCAQDPQVKKQLADATQAAIDVGIFGVPTFRLDNQLFWGDDRIDDLIRYRQGLRIDESRLADILSREAAAKRR